MYSVFTMKPSEYELTMFNRNILCELPTVLFVKALQNCRAINEAYKIWNQMS